MSTTLSRLPVRALRPNKAPLVPWVCRRCIADQATQTTPANYDPSLPARKRMGPNGEIYRLKKEDFYLKKPLPQERIPVAYLQHSTSELLHPLEQRQRENTVPHKKIVGVVVSSGLMSKTVKVRVAGLTYNRHIGKDYKTHENHLVHDPNSSLVTGDVVELHRLRVSKTVRHVVASIVSPFGTPVESRPPIPSPDDRLAAYKARRFAKFKRREERTKDESTSEDASQEAK